MGMTGKQWRLAKTKLEKSKGGDCQPVGGQSDYETEQPNASTSEDFLFEVF
jgi:hypothetical protein